MCCLLLVYGAKGADWSLFSRWTHFFDSPSQQSAGPRALGFEGFFRGSYAYHYHNNWYATSHIPLALCLITNLYPSLILRWNPFDPVRNWPDLGERFIEGERLLRLGPDAATTATFPNTVAGNPSTSTSNDNDDAVANAAGLPPVEKVSHDRRDLDWSTVLKRTFEAYVRGERPNMYGEWLVW